MQYSVGVIHGRFQVLHNDHLAYLLAGKALCKKLVVGITNPDPGRTAAEATDVQRGLESNNPLSYYQRAQLVEAVLLEQGIARDAFMVVPFPINLPQLYRWYVPLDATFFVTIYDDWGRAKLQRFSDLGLRTHVLRDVPNDEKGLSASQVRQLMQQGGNWQNLVPPAAARLLMQWDIPQRLLQLAQH